MIVSLFLVFRDNVSRVVPCSWATFSPWWDSQFSQNSPFSSLNRNERLSSCLISFSVAWTPHVEMTTLVRACTQTTQRSDTRKSLFYFEFPNSLTSLKWWIAPQPGPFLISFHVCSCEWNPDAGESWIQAPCHDPNHSRAPRQVHCFILLQISSLPHKVPSLRAIRMHLQAIRKVSDTY